MNDVSIHIALFAGFLSFFSPCILPLIPAYIMYITGSSLSEEIEQKKLFAFTRTLGFVLGFSLVFMIMGVSASFIGQLFIKYKLIFSKISGLLIMLFGLNMAGILNIGILNMELKMKSPKKVSTWIESILMGIAFGAGWTPCFGAVLGSILIYASSSSTISKGFYLLLFYSIGMGIPFIITSLIIKQFRQFLIKYRSFIPYISKFAAFMIIIFGVLIFLNKLSIISSIFT